MHIQHLSKQFKNKAKKFGILVIYLKSWPRKTSGIISKRYTFFLRFFCNSGAEANEAAIKLARKHTGKHHIITFEQSFHGRTFGSMTATGQGKIHNGFGPLVDKFTYLPFNDVDALKSAIDDTVAAIMLEVVQGEGGVNPVTENLLKLFKNLFREWNFINH